MLWRSLLIRILVNFAAIFLTVLLMPGLPDVPAAENMDIDDDENITGLY